MSGRPLSTYVFTVPVWAVAYWSAAPAAVTGLALTAAFDTGEGLYWHLGASSIWPNVLLTVVLWIAGRAVRRQWLMAGDLGRARALLEAEQRDREELALSAERGRMVARLNSLVAAEVSAMIETAESIRDQLGGLAARASSASIAEVEGAGRQALARLREILGLLRAGYDPDQFLPPPVLEGGVMTVRVLIADDQQLVRAGFRLILERQPGIEVVGEAASGAEAVTLARRFSPDVVLMDIRMPDLDGIQATRLIRADPGLETTRIIILTTYDLDEYVYLALRAGASGFLLKDLPPEQLAQAVLSASQGDSMLAPAITRRLIEHFTATSHSAALSQALGQLTPREIEVLQLLATGLSNAEIAAALFVAETTDKTHVARMLTKLGLRDRVQAVVFAYQHGLVPARPT